MQFTAMRMVMLPIKPWHKLKGFTLIEVLVALAIISIALLAIIKATSQTTRSTTHLQNQTIALWASQYILNEVKAGLINLSSSQEKEGEITILNKEWFYKINKEPTANPTINKIRVQIYNDSEASEESLLSVDTYDYQAQ